ncbi:MAG: LysR family transcriptional regulator [Alphaproteobacteria bacterium]
MDRIAAAHAFLRAVDTGSFTEVARELNTTQPTVSKQVAALEAHLGVQLLVRTTRSLALTEEGRRFYEQARVAIDAFEGAEAAARGERGVRGTLRLGCPVSFGQVQIVPRLKGFLAQHPDLAVELVMSDAFLDPVEQGVDVVIRIGNLADSSLTARRIGTARRATVASPAYVAQHGEPRAPAELAGHDCILYTRLATGAEWPFDGPAGPCPVRVAGRVRADNSAALRGAILDGLGIGMAPLWLVGEDIRAGRLVRLLKGFEAATLPIHAVSPPRRFTPPKVTAFVAHLAQEFRVDPFVSDYGGLA